MEKVKVEIISDLILSKIISYLSDIDKIIVTLACKGWFNKREKLISIFSDFKIRLYSEKGIDNSIDTYKNGFYLKSYKSIYEKSISLKRHGVYCYTHSKENSQENIEIPQCISNVYIYSIHKSNVNSLFERNSNLKSLEIGGTVNNTLQLDSLPRTIKHLKLSYYSTLDIGVLPEGLKSLTLFQKGTIQKEIKIGVFPSTLTDLSYNSSGKYTIEALPSKLHRLALSSHFSSGTTLLQPLPATLRKVELQAEWIPRLKDLPLLDTIKVSQGISYPINPNDIPSTLTSLDFGGNYFNLKCGIIPVSIRNLKLGYCIYQLYSKSDDLIIPFFPKDAEYDYLDLGLQLDHSILYKNELPQKIKELVICNYKKETEIVLEVGSIPDGVEKLTIYQGEQSFKEGIIPNSVTDLTIDYIKKKSKSSIVPLKFGEIPLSVQTLRYKNIACLHSEDYIPPSVRQVFIEYTNTYIIGDAQERINKSLQVIPKTVNNICAPDIFNFYRIDDKGNSILVKGLSSCLQYGMVNKIQI